MYILRKNFAMVFLLSGAIFLCNGCSDNGYYHLTHDDAKRIMASNPAALVIDVRTKDEYDRRHIPGAILIPVDDLKGGDFRKLPDRYATILIYCWTGRRAEDAAKILVEHGYKNVYEFGGLVDWEGSISGTNLK